MAELAKDEELVLAEYRKAKGRAHADVELTVKGGKLVKLWTVDKKDLAGLREVEI